VEDLNKYKRCTLGRRHSTNAVKGAVQCSAGEKDASVGTDTGAAERNSAVQRSGKKEVRPGLFV